MAYKLEQSERVAVQNRLRPAADRVEPVLKGDELLIATLDRLLHPHVSAPVGSVHNTALSVACCLPLPTPPHNPPIQLSTRASCAAQANTFDEYSREAIALGEEHPVFWEKRGEKRTLVWRRRWRHLQDNAPTPRVIECAQG